MDNTAKTQNEVIAEAMMAKAMHMHFGGRYAESSKLFETSITFADTPMAHRGLAFNLFATGNLDGAIEECKRAIEIDPEYGFAYEDIAGFLAMRGDTEEAKIWLDIALEKKHFNRKETVYYAKGKILEREGDWMGAYREYTTGININKEFKPLVDAYFAMQSKLQ